MTGGWSAGGYSQFAVHENNSFWWLWEAIAGAAWLEPLVVWGQLAIGLALLLGFAVRLAAFVGALQTVLFWMSALEGGLLAGLPVANGFVVSSHVVYALLLFGLGTVGAGRLLGLHRRIERPRIVRKNRGLTYLLG